MITYVAGFFILYLGIYVFRIPPRARVQKYFLGLCLMLSGWMIGFGMRMQVPIGIREIFANWILLPIPFISLFLDLVVCSIIGKKFKLNLYRTILIYILLPTFSLISLFGGYAKINGMSDYSFSPLFNYHLLMMFGFLSVIKSSLELGNAMIKKRGDKRIRSFLYAFRNLNLIINHSYIQLRFTFTIYFFRFLFCFRFIDFCNSVVSRDFALRRF